MKKYNCEMNKLASKSCESMTNFDDCSLNNISTLNDVSIGRISSQSIIPNIVRADDKAYSAKFALETIINLEKSVEPYLPLITATTSLIKQTVEAYEYAQYNKKSCAVLIQRIQATEVALNHCKQGNEKNFCKETYYSSFERLAAILKEIKGFIQDLTHLSGYRKFISNDNIKVRFQQLITNFDSIISDLQLIMFIATEEKRKKDIDILQKDINEMSRFLEKINGGVTTSDKKISNIFEYVITLKGKSSEKGFIPIINRIDSNELKEPIGGSQPVVSSRNKHKIHKKLYRGQDVSCKLIVEKQNMSDKSDIPSETFPPISNRVRAELSILSNLGKCDCIINFYGLCEKDGSVLGIFGWAENGNLRELCEKFDIEWPRKLKIALNICRGITFLHRCQILHHDIRCENILITDNLEPKVSNFKYRRALQANTTNISNIMEIVRWLAPERMNSRRINQEIARSTQQIPKKKESLKEGNEDDYVLYTIQCEIFSFGMLLWELAFQKLPYLHMEISEIQKHVLSGEREKLKFVNSQNSRGVEKEYGNMIKAEDSNRGLKPKKNEIEIAPADLRPSTQEIGLEQSIYPMMKLEDGIAAHKNEDREKAYDCFVKHAEINNKLAKYWLGYYHLEGYIVKNLDKAIELFKESADRGVPDAQLRYASRKFNVNEFERYLTMAADNENHATQYNLGDLYYNGNWVYQKMKRKF